MRWLPSLIRAGSEVTPFSVVTDEATGQKYPLADCELLHSCLLCANAGAQWCRCSALMALCPLTACGPVSADALTPNMAIIDPLFVVK